MTAQTPQGQPQAPINGNATSGGPAPVRQQHRDFPLRPKEPQDKLDSGKATFGVSCAFCHGSDAHGGEGGPNLLRSGIVLEDQKGELIAPIVHGGRVDQGMPRIDITDIQISDVAAWLHSLDPNGRPAESNKKINIVTGDVESGKAYFRKICASCHSTAGDLAGIASRIPDPKALQQFWLLPGSGRRGPGASDGSSEIHISPVTAIVTLSNGQKIDGELSGIDDFYVGVITTDGEVRSFRRDGDIPKVEIHDPLAPHRALMQKYTDQDIHNLTAYLVTLK